MMEITLHEAHQRIRSIIKALPAQTLSLSQALSRCLIENIPLVHGKPAFDQSTRDGFALAAPENDSHEFYQKKEFSYSIVGEIAAGDVCQSSLLPGTTYRIMTGAKPPSGVSHVIPFESVREENGMVFVPAAMIGATSHIRREGCEYKPGAVIVPKGVPLEPESLTALAADGLDLVNVHRKPLVLVVCTGTELVNPGILPGQGKKVSSNGVLLASLLSKSGAECRMVDPVSDDIEELGKVLRELEKTGPDMIITTGGMGPGKYDYLERVFLSLDGVVHYNRLRMRPGKATMFGSLSEKTVVFALPGPPPAVRLLYHELVAPALKVMNGDIAPEPIMVTAELAVDLKVKQTGHLNLKPGRAYFADGRLLVRPVNRLEPVNVILHCSGERDAYRTGDNISVHLLF